MVAGGRYMCAFDDQRGLGLVKGVDVQPDITEKAEMKQWCKDRDSAAGEIYLSLESSQRSMSRAWRKIL